jgi:anti-sigma B factor antagonist
VQAQQQLTVPLSWSWSGKEMSMAARPLAASVRHRPNVAIVDLHGDIDATSEDVLNAAYAEAGSQNPATIVLNFGDVQYIESTGIALIVSLLAQARKSRRRLVAYGLSEHYVRIFHITRLADFMSMFPDETSALATVPTS